MKRILLILTSLLVVSLSYSNVLTDKLRDNLIDELKVSFPNYKSLVREEATDYSTILFESNFDGDIVKDCITNTLSVNDGAKCLSDWNLNEYGSYYTLWTIRNLYIMSVYDPMNKVTIIMVRAYL